MMRQHRLHTVFLPIRSTTNYDYFTAVDDCSQEDNAGAGHLGTVEFNSFTMYRYATVNVMELYRHLGKDTAEVVEGFIKGIYLLYAYRKTEYLCKPYHCRMQYTLQ